MPGVIRGSYPLYKEYRILSMTVNLATRLGRSVERYKDGLSLLTAGRGAIIPVRTVPSLAKERSF
jgi:hypothetical protein